ncbi:MAG: GvpL/GvpF family gas vesicle protein [Nitrospirae bacterium]|nr:GvpL/GvpF family gas vesicle protein [Nitrospirota bacterium]
MNNEGKYIYGIIATEEAMNFGPIGIGGTQDEVVTVGAGGLAAVLSNVSSDRPAISRENVSNHVRVIETVAKRFTILPMRFCTVAKSTDEILALLEDRNRELRNLLRDMDGKVEVGIRILWKGMKGIYEEIVGENRKIRELKARAAGGSKQALTHAGQLVEMALEEKKAVEGGEYLRPLKKVSVECKEDESRTDNMVVNAVFLLDRDWVQEFDARIERISEEHGGRLAVKYVGPMPPFSFVNVQMHWNGGRR